MTLSIVICLGGLIIWGLFTKWQKFADGWVAEVGKLCFFCGLLSYLLVAGSKAVY